MPLVAEGLLFSFLRPSTLVVLVDLGLQMVIIARVISRRLPVGESMSWVLVAAAFPFAGPLLYLLFGELRLGARRVERFRNLVGPVRQWLRDLSYARGEPSLNTGGRPFAQLAEKSLGFPPMAGGRLQLLSSWQEAFDALIRDINAATQSCHLEFYIWNEGGRADEVEQALLDAAARGVKCRVLLDALGSRPFLRSPHADRLREGGVQLVEALPGGLWRMLFVRFDLRLHRKLVVIDGQVAYTGSMNLVDPRYFKQSAGVGQWVDAMTRIEGPPVRSLAITFLADWCVESGEAFEELQKADQREPVAAAGPCVMQAIPSGPAYGLNAMERALVTACYSATSELLLTTPYFVPEESLQEALVSAALRGVHVRLIAPRRVDSLLVRNASRAFYDELLRSGVEIWLFDEGLLHTKSVTIDGHWCLFGSLNLDPRSLHLNFELTLAIYDQEFTSQLRTLQLDYLRASEPLRRPELGHSTLQVTGQNLARLLAPLL